jgi:hypothetical protein
MSIETQLCDNKHAGWKCDLMVKMPNAEEEVEKTSVGRQISGKIECKNMHDVYSMLASALPKPD